MLIVFQILKRLISVSELVEFNLFFLPQVFGRRSFWIVDRTRAMVENMYIVVRLTKSNVF